MFEIFKIKAVKEGEEVRGSFYGGFRGGELIRGEENLVKVPSEENGFVTKRHKGIGDAGPSFGSFVETRISINTTKVPG